MTLPIDYEARRWNCRAVFIRFRRTAVRYSKQIREARQVRRLLFQRVPRHTQKDGIRSLQVSGRYAYVAALAVDRLTVVDIVNPANPTVVGSVYDEGYDKPRSVSISGAYAYVAAEGGHSLTVLDIADPEVAMKIGAVEDSVLNWEIRNVRPCRKYLKRISEFFEVGESSVKNL